MSLVRDQKKDRQLCVVFINIWCFLWGMSWILSMKVRLKLELLRKLDVYCLVTYYKTVVNVTFAWNHWCNWIFKHRTFEARSNLCKNRGVLQIIIGLIDCIYSSNKFSIVNNTCDLINNNKMLFTPKLRYDTQKIVQLCFYIAYTFFWQIAILLEEKNIISYCYKCNPIFIEKFKKMKTDIKHFVMKVFMNSQKQSGQSDEQRGPIVCWMTQWPLAHQNWMCELNIMIYWRWFEIYMSLSCYEV